MLEFHVNHTGGVSPYAIAMEDAVGTKLRTQRKLRDMTLEQVADAIGISPQALSQIECGTTKHAKPEHFLKLCAFYDVDPYQLGFGKSKAEIAAEVRRRRMSQTP